MAARAHLIQRLGAALAALLAAVLLGVGVWLERLNDERHQIAARAAVQAQLTGLRDRLSNQLVSDLQLVRGLISVVRVDPDIDQTRFEHAVLPLLAGRTNLRNVGAAPDMVIRMMAPLRGNERAIGLDYRTVPAQLEAAERARLTRQVVLAGPVALVQGGTGLIARLPVFIGEGSQERFWGLVSAVIDSDRLFAQVGLRDGALPLDVAIRGADARGAAGATFIGTAALFEGEPVLAEIELPQGSWQLAAAPRDGWPRHAPDVGLLRAGYTIVALLVLALFVLLLRALHRTAAARERAEAARAHVTAVLEGAPDATLLLSADDTIQRANPQAERLFGWPRAGIEGRPLSDLVRLDGRGLATSATRPPTISGRFELRGRRADGSDFPIEVSTSPLLVDEQPLVAAAFRDISARKAAEAELASYRLHLEQQVAQRTAQLASAKEAAEAASVAKTLFLTNMSHEIRTPLNAITGMAYLIRHAGVSAEQGERLDTLEAASGHLLQVINAILDLSKIESGQFELARVPMQPRSIVDAVAAMLGDTVRARGLRWISDVKVPPQPLLGDPTRLQQALLNYAANAVRFTSAGEVTVRVRVAAEQGDRICLHFEVQDTGVGIEPQALARLFKAFEQGDNSSTREHGGTGLGLVITRRLAELMGGQAGADSQAGAGSRFWFTAWLDKAPGGAGVLAMRAADGLPARAAVATAAAADPLRGRVLLVEDDLVNREIANFLLQDLGHTVELAADGLEAIERARGNDYDLILMDVQMPRMDGLEATRRIRALPRHGATPIVAITANAFDQDREACLDAGMNHFVPKPIAPAVLRAVVLECLGAEERGPSA